MSIEVVMPKAGLTMVEGTISEWKVAEGTYVRKGDVLMEYENEKNTIEYEALEEGYIHIIAQEGDTVPVGQIIAMLAAEKAESGVAATAGPEAPAAAPVAATADAVEVVMPKAGLTMVEGTISEWKVAEGDYIHKGDVLMEYENEKNTIEYEALEEGYIHLIAKEGDTVQVGGLIAVLTASKGDAQPAVKAAPAATVTAAPVAAVSAAPEKAVAAASDARVRATGYAKKLAKDNNLSLAGVKGTGPNGRVVARDVRKALETKPAVSSASASAVSAPAAPMVACGEAAVDVVTKLPMSGVRKAIANNMYNSLQSMAQCTAAVEIDVTDLLAYRQKLLEQQEFLGCRVTVNDLLSMATVKMLKKHPMANATFDGKTLYMHSSVNLSVAVAAEAGLMVPVVKGADKMNLVQLHNAAKDLADRAREKKLRDGEQSNGTFTISNVGMFPIDWSTAIINPPQVAILGFGRSVKKMVVVNDAPAVRSMMTMYLTFDHRVFDGLEVGRIMKDMQTLLEHPELITA